MFFLCKKKICKTLYSATSDVNIHEGCRLCINILRNSRITSLYTAIVGFFCFFNTSLISFFGLASSSSNLSPALSFCPLGPDRCRLVAFTDSSCLLRLKVTQTCAESEKTEAAGMWLNIKGRGERSQLAKFMQIHLQSW